MEMPRLGTRKLYYLLKDKFNSQGIKIGRDALFTYLCTESMLIKLKKSYTKTTNSKHWLHKYDNLMQGEIINTPEQCFVSDDMDSENEVKALRVVINSKVTNNRTIHHLDRGLQYCSKAYQSELNKHKIKPSMITGYDYCYQNALAERVNGILKQGFLNL